MSVLEYSRAITLIAEALTKVENDKRSEMAKYFMGMAINALTDTVNGELGFVEPERPICNCEKFAGPDFGKEKEFYAKAAALKRLT